MRILLASSLALCVMLPSAADARRQPREATLAQLAARSPAVDRDQDVAVAEGQAAQSYRDFLQIEAADPALRAAALRRLGDLSLARAESLHATGPASGDESASAFAEAIRAYSQLLDSYPDHERADESLYQLARAYEGSGQPELTLHTLDRLVAEYPATPYFDEAQFRRGEMLFSAQRWGEAESAFAAVARPTSGSEFRQAALYKQAWALFKQSKDAASGEAFLQLLDTLLAGGNLSRPEREMADDALRALSIGFAAAEGPRSLQAALERHGSVVYEARLYGALGDLYVEKERYQDAAEAYRAFARRSPADPDAPLLLVRAIEAYQSGGFTALVLEGKREFVETYGPRSAFWRERSGVVDSKLAAALQANLLDLARHHHAVRQDGGAEAELELAVRWYREYLEGFPDSPQAPGTRLLLADLLFENERFASAARDYEVAAYEYPGFADAPRAGYAALVALDRAVDVVPQDQRASLQQRALESSIRFADAFPGHEAVPAVLTRATQQLFDAGDRERAEEFAGRVLALGARADASQQRVAWSVLGNTWFEAGRYAEAEDAFRQLAALLPAGDPELAQVSDRLAACVYRQAEARQAAGDVDGAVQDFLRVAEVAPASAVRASAEYDAATLLLQAGQWERAAHVLEGFRRGHPGHELQPEVARKLAVAYLEGGRALEAAAEFEQLATRAEDPPELRRAALWQAAELYRQAGDPIGEKRCFETYVGQFPVPLDAAMEARQALADLALAAGDAGGRRSWLEAIVAADLAGGSRRSDRSRTLAARASLEIGRAEDAVARSVRLVVPLERTLLAKKQAMDRALEAYVRSADSGVAECATESTFRIADLYRHLGEALTRSERPRGLSAEELEQYELLLEEQAFPFEEKAIDVHAANAERAADGLFDEWVRRSFAALAEISPGRYSKPEALALASARPESPAEAGVAFAVANAALQAGEDARAIEFLEQALGIEPDNAPGWNQLGIAYRRLGRFADARSAYQRAIATDPLLREPERNLGILHELYLAAPERAVEHYERFLAPDAAEDPEVKAWLADLRRRIERAPRTVDVQP